MTKINSVNILPVSNNQIKTNNPSAQQINDNAVNNKSLKNGDIVTIPLLNKEIKKPVAIIGGLAAIAAVAVGILALSKKPGCEVQTTQSVEKMVQKELDAINSAVKKLDSEANEASKRAENLLKSVIEAMNKGSEKRSDGTLIREVQNFGNYLVEYAQDGKTVTRKTEFLLDNISKIEEYIGNRKNVFVDTLGKKSYIEYEKLEDGTFKPLRETIFRGGCYFNSNSTDFSLSEKILFHWENGTKESFTKLQGKPAFYNANIEVPYENFNKESCIAVDCIGSPNVGFNTDGSFIRNLDFNKYLISKFDKNKPLDLESKINKILEDYKL